MDGQLLSCASLMTSVLAQLRMNMVLVVLVKRPLRVSEFIVYIHVDIAFVWWRAAAALHYCGLWSVRFVLSLRMCRKAVPSGHKLPFSCPPTAFHRVRGTLLLNFNSECVTKEV